MTERKKGFGTCGYCGKSWRDSETMLKLRLKQSRSGLIFCGLECAKDFRKYGVRGKK
jgi:hypothetical protein